MRTEAEAGEMQLPAKVGPQSSEEARKDSAQSLRGRPCRHLGFSRLAPRTWDSEFLLL